MKRIGAISESHFASKALSKGFQVCKPTGDFAAYDFIVEKSGKLLKIQVKATNTKRDGSYQTYLKKGGGSAAYAPNDFDVLAIHVYKLDVWYLVPKKRISGRNVRVKGNGTGQGKYEDCFEGWNLLEDL